MRKLPTAALALGLALPAALAAPPASAATVTAAQLTINQFDHRWTPDQRARDIVTIPGTAYTNRGYGVTIAPGDVIAARFQAPAGKKFFVHAPTVSPTRSMRFDVTWRARLSVSSVTDAYTVRFEKLKGPAPTETQSYVRLGDDHGVVGVQLSFQFSEAFEFTAMVVEIAATRLVAPVTQAYSDFYSTSAPSIYVAGTSSVPTAPLVEIVDESLLVPALSTSWGRVKALYR